MEGRGAGLPAKARGPAAVRRGPKADFALCWWVCRGWGPSRGRQRGLPNPVCGVTSRQAPQRGELHSMAPNTQSSSSAACFSCVLLLHSRCGLGLPHRPARGSRSPWVPLPSRKQGMGPGTFFC